MNFESALLSILGIYAGGFALITTLTVLAVRFTEKFGIKA